MMPEKTKKGNLVFSVFHRATSKAKLSYEKNTAKALLEASATDIGCFPPLPGYGNDGACLYLAHKHSLLLEYYQETCDPL